MRIAVAANDNQGLEGTVSEHFGRCPYYTLADVEDGEIKEVEVVNNPFYLSHGQQGEVPSFIHSQGVNLMITGGMGPHAIGFFNQFGIDVVTGASGKVGNAINICLRGELSGAQPCSEHGGEIEHSDEIFRLRNDAEALQRQLAEINKKIAQLE
jgi:predicted Fe-Mo cluster-binding NifX family protein